MDQGKIGRFLKENRLENNLTQEQLAERLGVSRRTVSRRETGSNLPDLDLLIELSDLYALDLRELLDGERKETTMQKELEETVRKVADYSSERERRLKRRLHALYWIGLGAMLLYVVLLWLGQSDGALGGVSLGFATGMLLIGILITGRNITKLQAIKARLLGKKDGAA